MKSASKLVRFIEAHGGVKRNKRTDVQMWNLHGKTFSINVVSRMDTKLLRDLANKAEHIVRRYEKQTQHLVPKEETPPMTSPVVEVQTRFAPRYVPEDSETTLVQNPSLPIRSNDPPESEPLRQTRISYRKRLNWLLETLRTPPIRSWTLDELLDEIPVSLIGDRKTATRVALLGISKRHSDIAIEKDGRDYFIRWIGSDHPDESVGAVTSSVLIDDIPPEVVVPDKPVDDLIDEARRAISENNPARAFAVCGRLVERGIHAR